MLAAHQWYQLLSSAPSSRAGRGKHKGPADLKSAVDLTAGIAQAGLDAVQLVQSCPAAVGSLSALAVTQQPGVHQALATPQQSWFCSHARQCCLPSGVQAVRQGRTARLSDGAAIKHARHMILGSMCQMLSLTTNQDQQLLVLRDGLLFSP